MSRLESTPARLLEALALLIECLILLPSASQAATCVMPNNSTGNGEKTPLQDQEFEPKHLSYDPEELDGPESDALPLPGAFFRPSDQFVSLPK